MSVPASNRERASFTDAGSWLGNTFQWYKWQFTAPAVEQLEEEGPNGAATWRRMLEQNGTPMVDSPAGTLRYGARYDQHAGHGLQWYYSWAICAKWRGTHDLTCQKARFYAETFLFASKLEEMDAAWERGWLDPQLSETGYYGHLNYSERRALTRKRKEKESFEEQIRAQLEEQGVEDADAIQNALREHDVAVIRKQDQELLKENLKLAALATANASVASATKGKDSLADRYLSAAKSYDAQLKSAVAGLRRAGLSKEAAQQYALFPAPSQRTYEDGRQLGSWFHQQAGKTKAGYRAHKGGDSVELELAALEARVKGDQGKFNAVNKAIESQKVQQAWRNYISLVRRPPRLLDLATKNETHFQLQQRLAREAFHRTKWAVQESQKTVEFEKIKSKWQKIVAAPGFFFDEEKRLKAIDGVSSLNAFKYNHSLTFEKLLNASVVGAWKKFYGDAYPLSSAAGAKELSNPDKLRDYQKRFDGLYNWVRRNHTQFLYLGMAAPDNIPTRELNYENPGVFEVQSSFGTRLWPESKFGSGRPWLFDFEKESENPRPRTETHFKWTTEAA